MLGNTSLIRSSDQRGCSRERYSQNCYYTLQFNSVKTAKDVSQYFSLLMLFTLICSLTNIFVTSLIHFCPWYKPLMNVCDLCIFLCMCMQVRVLVTNGIGFLPQCDQIVVLDEGQISEFGTYDELIDSDGAFAEFIRTFTNVQEDVEGDPGNY